MILEKKQIDECFEADDQWGAFLNLHLLLQEDEFIKGEHQIAINNFPLAGEELVNHIYHKFIAFDREHHPDVLSGGLWMNSGWSIASDLGPWEVEVPNGAIEYVEVNND